MHISHKERCARRVVKVVCPAMSKVIKAGFFNVVGIPCPDNTLIIVRLDDLQLLCAGASFLPRKRFVSRLQGINGQAEGGMKRSAIVLVSALVAVLVLIVAFVVSERP